ncbi:aldo/keto reductase [Microbispora sp. NEAU-D428]|uniref:aldo/keto reductase n=1 Tax=Microbispora sitophila TaxID=2771537 RepID=UPI0018679E6C|nr:aldo/keto reductase [Microbispora sitophila]MBE3016050.1 aldo/keto reductase [Microbispora sitophila]
MEIRPLGHSGLLVSEISYGTWVSQRSQVDEHLARQCVQAALDEGITTFDTADVHADTRAEDVLGRVLKGACRESLQILTKVHPSAGSGRGLSREHITESIHGSLRRLRTDYVDLYQVHGFDSAASLDEMLDTLDDLVRQGKARHVGVSGWNAEQIAQALEIADEMGFRRIVSNQAPYSMVWRLIEGDVVPLCEKEGLGQIVWAPIAQGVLTGKHPPGRRPPARTIDPGVSQFMPEDLTDDMLIRVQRLKPIAADLGLSMAQLAIAWVLRHQNVASAVVCAGTPDQPREAAKASGVTLDAEVLQKIDEVLEPVTQRSVPPA